MSDVSISRALHPTDEIRELIALLDEELAGEYEPHQRHGLDIASLFEPNVRFFIVRREGVAIACGGSAVFEKYAEVKRMYVRVDARGSGLARMLLAYLEAEARSMNLHLLRLETGIRQTAAMRLYERFGFEKCDAFGAYASMPAASIETSVFYEKLIEVAGR